MNAGYQRLDAEASDILRQMAELSKTADLGSACLHAKFEQQNADLGRKRGSLHQAMALVRTANSAEMRKKEREFVQALPKKFHSQGSCEKRIHLPGDVTVTILVTYYHRCRCPKAGQHGRRGLYPMLMLRGIAGRFTPRMRSRMAKAAALLGSYDEAAVMLAEEGIDVSVNQLFLIYAVDEQGRMADDFPPVIDGTLGSCDQLFVLLLAYLRGLKLTEASRVLFVADGAAWIWRRIPKLVKSLGLKEENVQQLIDFWHAMEYLGKIAESKSLKGSRKTHWLKIQKKRLWRGEIGTVVEEIQTLMGSRKTKEQKTWLNDFINHGLTHRRMDYSRSHAQQMPIGSGAIETLPAESSISESKATPCTGYATTRKQ